jgi:hypothetical protein
LIRDGIQNLTNHDHCTITFISFLIFLFLFLPFAMTLTFPLPSVFSDSLTGGALTQRIGNFDVELKTVPEKPLAGEKTKMFLRIGTINGDDVVDMPITIKLAKQGEQIDRTNRIVVPDGHYTHTFQFPESGIYGVDIEIQNYYAMHKTEPSSSSSSLPSSQSRAQSILFTFPIEVYSKSVFGFSDFEIALIIGAVAVVASAIIFFTSRKKRNTMKSKSYQ